MQQLYVPLNGPDVETFSHAMACLSKDGCQKMSSGCSDFEPILTIIHRLPVRTVF